MDSEIAQAFTDLRNHIDTKFAGLPCTQNTAFIAAIRQELKNGKEYEEKSLKAKAVKFTGYRVFMGACLLSITIIEFLSKFVL